MTKSAPKVTVIIPVYNREKFIRETLNSALSQTYPNIEVIVVDDGSTDGTRAILDAFDQRIRILEHPGTTNKGQSAAINLALRRANGEYVAILDSDDLWMPSKLETQVKFLEDNREVGFVYANGYVINEKGKILYRLLPGNHTETGRPEDMLLYCHCACPSAYLVRCSVFRKVGEFDETLRSAQDHDMAVRIAEVTRLAYIDEVLWYYRRHPESQSGKHARRRWEAGFRILDKACSRYPYGPSVRRKRLAVLHFRLAQCCLEDRARLRGLRHFALAGLKDPHRAIRVLLGREAVTSPH